MQYFYLVSYRWTSFYIEYRSKLNYMWSLIVSRASYLASSRSVTHKTSTPCLLSWKVCLLSVMIYFFYGNGRLAHHPTRRTFSFQDHQGTQIFACRLYSSHGSSSVARLYLAKNEAPEQEAVSTTLLKCATMHDTYGGSCATRIIFFFWDVNMFCILI